MNLIIDLCILPVPLSAHIHICYIRYIHLHACTPTSLTRHKYAINMYERAMRSTARVEGVLSEVVWRVFE